MQHNSDLADNILTEVSTPLEDYGLLSNRITAALVSRDGSIDWFCPLIDGDALFTAILGYKKHGRWQLSVVEALVDKRWYDGEEFRLPTLWHAPNGGGAERAVNSHPPPRIRRFGGGIVVMILFGVFHHDFLGRLPESTAEESAIFS